MTKAEYEQLKKNAEISYKKDIEAIERVFSLSQSGGQQVSLFDHTSENDQAEEEDDEATDNSSGEANSFEKGVLLKAVQAATKSMVGPFTIKEVFEELQKNGIKAKLTSVSGAINNLVNRGFITVASVGSGRRPSRFIKNVD